MYNHHKTEEALALVLQERYLQEQRYGHVNDTLADGTGSGAIWLRPFSNLPAVSVEKAFRADYERFEQAMGNPTWIHLLREELAEVAMEKDPARLEVELIQLAALCVSWVERLHERKRTQ